MGDNCSLGSSLVPPGHRLSETRSTWLRRTNLPEIPISLLPLDCRAVNRPGLRGGIVSGRNHPGTGHPGPVFDGQRFAVLLQHDCVGILRRVNARLHQTVAFSIGADFSLENNGLGPKRIKSSVAAEK